MHAADIAPMRVASSLTACDWWFSTPIHRTYRLASQRRSSGAILYIWALPSDAEQTVSQQSHTVQSGGFITANISASLGADQGGPAVGADHTLSSPTELPTDDR
jgi:hypothetical protein